MVDETEFDIIDADERREVPVVIKFFDVLGKWSICHQRSHQGAFRKEVNMFDTKQEAIEFAENNDCIVCG